MTMELYIGKPHSEITKGENGYALAHEMQVDDVIEAYKSTKNLILDNGADELGEGQGGHRLTYLAGRLNPEWVILPDILHKDKKTRQNGEEFYENLRTAGYKGKFMSVIQAKTLDKGLESYKFWAESGMVDRIGITYDTKIEGLYSKEFSWGNRLGFLYEIADRGLYEAYGVGVHLLGTLEVNELFTLFHYDEFEKYGVRQMVESHDTTAPWACPTKFHSGVRSIQFDRPKNWERLDFNKELTFYQRVIAYWNVACYLSACLISKDRWVEYMPIDCIDDLWEQFEHHYD